MLRMKLHRILLAQQINSVFTLKSEKKYTSNEPKVLGKIDLVFSQPEHSS